MNSGKDDFEQQFINSVKNASQPVQPIASQPIASQAIVTPPETEKSHFSQPVAPLATEAKSHSPLPLIISIVLAVIVVLQSIALIVVISNHFAMFNTTDEEYYEEDDEVISSDDAPYLYNDEDYLIAMAATCTAEDGSYLRLTKNNNFEEYGIVSAPIDPSNRVSQTSDTDKTASLIDSGTYSITRDSVFTFNKSSGAKTLFFDGYTLTDGTVFYDCEEEFNSESQGE